MSKLFSLNWKDNVKGLIIFILSAVFTALFQMLESTPIVIDWSQIFSVAFTALTAYLSKNFLTDSQEKLFGRFSIGGSQIPPKKDEK